MVYELDFQVGNTKCILVSVQPFNTPSKREVKYYEHCHPCFEFHYVEEGSSTFLCNKKQITISKKQWICYYKSPKMKDLLKTGFY